MTFLSEGIKGVMGAKSLLLQENAPKILFGTGVLSMIGSTVLACHATLKVEELLDQGKNDMEKIHAAEAIVEYTEEDARKDTLIVYSRTALRITKQYAPAI